MIYSELDSVIIMMMMVKIIVSMFYLFLDLLFMCRKYLMCIMICIVVKISNMMFRVVGFVMVLFMII